MNWRFLRPFSSVSCYTAAGASLYFLLKEEKLKIVENSSKSHKNKLSEFDLNWDHRAEYSLVKPLKDSASSGKQKRHSEKLEKYRSKAKRHILLIRHGQYFLNGDPAKRILPVTDKDKVLTQLGREQATITGERLKQLDIKFTETIVSTMTRAKETADIILSQLPEARKLQLKIDSMLEEGAPIGPEPKIGSWKPMEYVSEEVEMKGKFHVCLIRKWMWFCVHVTHARLFSFVNLFLAVLCRRCEN
jgi:serine/threonine-protein phosphatase PGAM5